jgi:hypothetical protein
MIKWARKLLLARIVELEQRLKAKDEEVQNLRAHLMELRVSNESPKTGAIGWMVSAFVPETAIKALRRKPERIPDLVQLVAEALVSSAIRQILRIGAEGKIQALIFEPVTSPDQKVIRTRPWFETDTVRAEKLTYEQAKRLAEETERECEQRRRMLW